VQDFPVVTDVTKKKFTSINEFMKNESFAASPKKNSTLNSLNEFLSLYDINSYSNEEDLVKTCPPFPHLT